MRRTTLPFSNFEFEAAVETATGERRRTSRKGMGAGLGEEAREEIGEDGARRDWGLAARVFTWAAPFIPPR